VATVVQPRSRRAQAPDNAPLLRRLAADQRFGEDSWVVLPYLT